MAARKTGDPNPYVIGNSAVQRYVKISEECAGELVAAETKRSRPTAAVDHFASDTPALSRFNVFPRPCI
jgi:hypothetical protein